MKEMIFTLWYAGYVNKGIDLAEKHGLNIDDLVAEYEERFFDFD